MQVQLLRRGEFARALGVSETTVNRWLSRGAVTFVRMPGGERRIPATEVDRILGATTPPTDSAESDDVR